MILGFITLQRYKTFQIQCRSCGLCIYFKPFLPQLLFTPFITHCLNVKKKKSKKKKQMMQKENFKVRKIVICTYIGRCVQWSLTNVIKYL